jgi:hypothetical protein
MQPLGRSPALAEVVLFLLSDASAAVSGVLLPATARGLD